MEYSHALILALVEGITEFLPISSTGHLILSSKVLGIEQTEFVKSFEIIIQLGAIFAVIFLYHKTLLTNSAVWKRIIIAFLPSAVFGLVFYQLIKQVLLGNTYVTLVALFVGGIVLITLELFYKEKDLPAARLPVGQGRQEHHAEKIEDISLQKALAIGLCQSLAMIPGVSRAAATIIGALFLGARRKTAVEFSFLLAIPTMFAASTLDIIKTNFSFSSYEYSLLAVGFIGSFIVAILAIKFFLQFIKNHTFIPFGVYRIVLALLFWIFIM